MKLVALLLYALLIQPTFAQNLKLSNITVSAGQIYVRDPYRSFDYFKGYATDPSALDADSMNLYQYSDLTPSPKSLHQTVWYTGKTTSLNIGFKPKKENREINFGVYYSSVKQSGYSGNKDRSLPWDTVTITSGTGQVDTFFSTLYVTDRKDYRLSTKNLFVSAEYLFKSTGSCIQYYAGIGLRAGFSISTSLYNNNSPMISEVLYNPSTHEAYTNNNIYNYPSWFYDEPQIQYTGEYYTCKQIFYFDPYIPFGMRIPLSQSSDILSRFSLDLKGSVGLEAQLMKKNTLMIRQVFSGNAGLSFSF